MAVHPTDAAASRRRSLLATLLFAPAATATVRELLRDMEVVHNIPASADLLRGDLSWLREQGLVQYVADTAQITERGRDVARRAAPWPGE